MSQKAGQVHVTLLDCDSGLLKDLLAGCLMPTIEVCLEASNSGNIVARIVVCNTHVSRAHVIDFQS